MIETAKTEIVSPSTLTPEQVTAYDRDGFLVLPLYDASELRRLRALVEQELKTPLSAHPRVLKGAACTEPNSALDPRNPYGVFKIFNTPLIGDEWFALMRDERVLNVVADLIGGDVNFLMGWLHQRVPGLQVHEGWHRDFTEDRHTTTDLITTILYLDEMTTDSGPTLVVPGSHKGALVGDSMETVPAQVPGRDDYQEVVVPAGSVLFLHCLTLHSLSMNTTPVDRSVILHEYKSASAIELTVSDFAFADLPLLRDGRRI